MLGGSRPVGRGGSGGEGYLGGRVIAIIIQDCRVTAVSRREVRAAVGSGARLGSLSGVPEIALGSRIVCPLPLRQECRDGDGGEDADDDDDDEKLDRSIRVKPCSLHRVSFALCANRH
jgi:hypothetical protein